MDIPLSLIDADIEQPRQHFVQTELQELLNSIQENGILQPLIVESNYSPESPEKYLLLDGERRYRCAKQLNLSIVPVVVVSGPLSFEERTVRRFHIQEQHKNWSIFDKARTIALLKSRSDMNFVEIGKKIGLQAPIVHAWISMNDFTPFGQALILENKIKFAYLIFLIRLVKRSVKISERSQEEIETLWIQRIVNRDISSITDINKLSQLTQNEEYREKTIRLLEENAYSVKTFFIETGLQSQQRIAKISILVDELLALLQFVDKATLSEVTRKKLSDLSTEISQI